MGIKYTKKFKDYIKYLVDTSFPHINHKEYKCYLIFEQESAGDDLTLATCNPYSPYLEFPIYIYPALYKRYKNKEYEYVASTVVHELAHLFIGPISVEARKYVPEESVSAFSEMEERQTQRIADAIFALLPTKWWDPNNMQKSNKDE